MRIPIRLGKLLSLLPRGADDSVVGIEQSPSMVVAAQTLLAPCPSAKVVEGDIREDLPEGPFDLIFLGGLCMYLNDLDVVRLYQDLFREAGFPTSEFRRNYAYTSMEVAVELVETRRKYLRFLPAQSPFLGALTWYSLRAIAPLTFWLLPRVLSRLQIKWPRLQNHFFRLRSPESSRRSDLRHVGPKSPPIHSG